MKQQNTVDFRNQDMSITDLEYNHDLDMNGGDPMAVKNSITTQMPKAVIEPSIASEQQQQQHRHNDNIESAKYVCVEHNCINLSAPI